MGIKSERRASGPRTAPTMLDALFSKTQQRVLSLVMGSPSRKFLQKEIITAAKVGSGTVQRELLKLVEAGLVQAESEGALKRYRANVAAPIFEELKSIFEKTIGLSEPLKTALRPIQSKIELAFVYGSIAKGSDRAMSDIDLIVVSDRLSLSELYERLMPIERHLGRTINLTLYKMAEFEREKQFSFLKSVLVGNRIVLIEKKSDSDRREKIR